MNRKKFIREGLKGVGALVALPSGRAPHLHLEIKRADVESLLITQTAFPEEVSSAVYATNGYCGIFDTPNDEDGPFANSLNRNIATSVVGIPRMAMF